MLALPPSTEKRQTLSKAQLYKQLEVKPSLRTSFDADVTRLDFVHVIRPQSLPSMSEGKEVKAIFVAEAELERHSVHLKTFEQIAKLIPHKIVYALRHGEDVMLAVYHDRLFVSPWQAFDKATLPIIGLNLDVVWQNMVCHIGSFMVEKGVSLSEQIQRKAESDKLAMQIARLERQMANEKQPHRKYALFEQLNKLKSKTTPSYE